MKFYLSFFCLVYPAIILAQNAPVERADDIIGCYEKINFSEEAQKQINDIEPWPMPYQWFCFESDGTLYTMGSNRYEKHSSKSLREIFKVLPKDITYTIIQPGIIKTEQKSVNQTLIWGGNFMGAAVLFDQTVFEKGTFFMSIFSPKKQKNIYYRYLKKLD